MCRHHHVVGGDHRIRWILREWALIQPIGHLGTGAIVEVPPIMSRNFAVRFAYSKFCSYGGSHGTLQEFSALHSEWSPQVSFDFNLRLQQLSEDYYSYGFLSVCPAIFDER